jgi:hypothetical protein
VLEVAPTPAQGRSLSSARIAAVLKRAGRHRRITQRAEEIRGALRSSQLQAPEVLARAYGDVVRSTVRILAEMTVQIQTIAKQLEEGFEGHPDAEILCSLPGLGSVLGPRVLAEFGDDPARYADPKARKNYAGTSPITKASGRSKVALAGLLATADSPMRCRCGRSVRSAPRRARGRYYDAHRARGQTHHRALRSLANRWVGILHGCLCHRERYSERMAWPTLGEAAA